jgi:alpha-ketoglutaric semialdehyde dehydrogenase
MTVEQIAEHALRQSDQAFESWRQTSPEQRARFLDAIAFEIEALGDILLQTAAAETNLSEVRLIGERQRTTGQLRMFAGMLREGSWVEATIDTAGNANPDLRQMMIPIGPVIVFGASNFPFAYSTAGGDTASALAAGCSVVVKAHPAHPRTSSMVADAIARAAASCGISSHVFQHIEETGFEMGEALVLHPLSKAIGFTGSVAGGLALQEYARQRPEPIPVFAEMGSVNPIILLPEAISGQSDTIAEACAASISLGLGQFCTNPGLIFGIDCPELKHLLETLGALIQKTPPGRMLHPGINHSYHEKRARALESKGVYLLGSAVAEAPQNQAGATVAWVAGEDFLKNPHLHEEVFGPFSLCVRCKDAGQLAEALQSFGGQLTCSIWATTEDLRQFPQFLDIAQRKAGRIVLNGVPTGVAVVPSMTHGGPFPATTDSRFTAVGIHAVRRWVRPISFQNFPDMWLPEELQNHNPRSIWRSVNGQITRDKITQPTS